MTFHISYNFESHLAGYGINRPLGFCITGWVTYFIRLKELSHIKDIKTMFNPTTLKCNTAGELKIPSHILRQQQKTHFCFDC